MYYIEALRSWHVYWRYLIVIAGLYLLAAVLTGLSPHVGTSDTRVYSAGGHAALVAFVCLLFASISGSSLSRHIDHLDFALTKPQSRTAFVARVFGVDVLGLTVFFITTTIAVLIFHIGLGLAHPLAFD